MVDTVYAVICFYLETFKNQAHIDEDVFVEVVEMNLAKTNNCHWRACSGDPRPRGWSESPISYSLRADESQRDRTPLCTTNHQAVVTPATICYRLPLETLFIPQNAQQELDNAYLERTDAVRTNSQSFLKAIKLQHATQNHPHTHQRFRQIWKSDKHKINKDPILKKTCFVPRNAHICNSIFILQLKRNTRTNENLRSSIILIPSYLTTTVRRQTKLQDPNTITTTTAT